MRRMKNAFRLLPMFAAALCGTLVPLLSAPVAFAAEPLLALPVWNGTPPGETAPAKPEQVRRNKQGGIAGVSNIWTPTLDFFPAPEDKNTGAAVLVCPGGGYSGLAYEFEGTNVAKWFNSIGVNAIILKYRVPRRPNSLFGEIPLKDSQRALSVVRAKAAEWKIDPTRLGIMGFSAGGHLSAITSVAEKRTYEPTDDADKLSCRPNFTILVYPAYMTENGKDSHGSGKRANPPKSEDELTPRVTPGKGTPPAICFHSLNDAYTSDGSLLYFRALKKANIPAELHIYASGAHGWVNSMAPETWNPAVAAWLKHSGFLKK
jgi:acetyl esterase/lipase